MRRITSAAVALATVVAATPALAFNQKSYVSSSGNDSNSCAGVFNACATLQAAHDKTAPGGDIGVLDPGNYGRLIINRAINITNDGVGTASILVPLGSNGITITAGAGDIVSLRGLVIDGQGVGATGIQVNQANAVHIQNCVIRNFEANGGGIGVLLFPAIATKMFISDTIIFNNGSTAASGGILVKPFNAGTASVVLDRVHLENNVVGLRVDGTFATGDGSHVVIRDSVVSGNAADGVLAVTTAGHAPSFVVVERTTSVSNAGTGIRADGAGATMLLSADLVARNSTGISAVNGGQLISYGNNKFNNNLGPDGTPTGSYSPI